ncbi:MAG: PorV/PorQ family protein [Bacteroidota bacterium]
MKQPARTMSIIALAFLVLVSTVYTTAYAGGENRVGTNAASELLIPVGAREIAMGGSSIATTSGIEAIFWNPAGLARAERSTNAMFSHMNYIADIGVEYVAVSAAFEGFGTLGFSLKSLSIGDINVTTEDSPDGNGQLMSPTVVNVGLTYSRLLTDQISVGSTLTLISNRFDRVAANGFSFSAGVQYTGIGGVNGLSLGVAVKHIGPQMKFEGDGLLRQGNVNDVLRPGSFYRVTAASFELPSTIELGLGYEINVGEQNSLNVAGVFQNNNFSSDEYKLGVEYGYEDMFFLRGGYDVAESKENSQIALSDQTSYIFGFTAGAGIHYAMGSLDLSVDYAYRAVEFLDNNHIFSLKLGF